MTTATDTDDLLARFRAMQARAPHGVRARDAADSLGVSEGALTEARRGSGEAVPLRAGREGILSLMAGLPAVGEALALTRNAHCVHERTGRYAAPVPEGAGARIDGAGIAMDLILDQWHAAYALTEPTHIGVRASIQVFDACGDAVHKVYQTEATDSAAFGRLIAEAAAPAAPPARLAPDEPLAEPVGEAGRALSRDAVERVLEAAGAGHVPLSIVVGNRGCVQRYVGPVEAIKLTGPWVNVLDPEFNLHLRWDRIADARLTAAAGEGPALEVRDAAGFRFCRIAGADPASAAWHALAAALPAAV